MEKIYKGNFSEIEKLVDENMIEGHPYEDLYRYIRMTNMETLRKNCIRRTLSNNLESTRDHIENNFNRICGENLDFSMQPYLIGIQKKLVKRYSNEIGQIKTLENYNDFENMVEKIYENVMGKINESPKLVQEGIDKLYKKMVDECIETLIGIRYKGKDIVETFKPENGEEKPPILHREVVKELVDELEEKDLDSLYLLEKQEIKKLNLAKRSLELSDDINNSKNIVYTYLLKKTQEKIKYCEKTLNEILHNNTHLAKQLVSDNIIEFENGDIKTINLNLERLAELGIKMKGNEFDFLNVWCRLRYIENYFISNIEAEYLEEIKVGKRKIKNIKDKTEIPDLETIDIKNLEVQIEKCHKKYREKKAEDYNDVTKALAHSRNNSAMFTSKKIKELADDPASDIVALTMPAPAGMISRKNALYITRVLTAMEENKEELNKFLNNDNVAAISNKEENLILNSTMNLVNEFVKAAEIVEEPKQNVKKIGTKGE